MKVSWRTLTGEGMFFPLKDENPTEKKPILTVTLIVANVGIFLFAYLSGQNAYEQILSKYGMIPNEISKGINLHTIFTSMFLHGGFVHLIGNVLFLWIFGDNIEDLFGRSKFLLIYFGSGVAASLAHVAFNPNSTVTTIGASGAIAGILGAYIVKYPRAKVLTLFFFLFIRIVRVPAALFLGLWIGLQIISGSLTLATEMPVSVAYWAHIGGFVAGMYFAFILKERTQNPREKITRRYFQSGGGS